MTAADQQMSEYRRREQSITLSAPSAEQAERGSRTTSC